MTLGSVDFAHQSNAVAAAISAYFAGKWLVGEWQVSGN
jgi:hypothetical protein